MENLRPCRIEIGEETIETRSIHGERHTKVIREAETHKGYFHTWGSEAYVTNGYLVGTTAGQMSTLYGVVEYEDGTVHRVPPECITFTDSEIGMCEFCKDVKAEKDFDIENPYFLFEKAFSIEVPSDDGIRYSVDNISFCPYCGRKLVWYEGKE